MPFRVSSNTGHFYLGPYYREVYQELFENIREGKRALLLTSYAGAGKTTLIRQVIDNLEGMVRPIRIQRSHLNFESFMDEIGYHLSLEPDSDRVLTEKISALQTFQAEQSLPLTVIVDQADQLSHETLVALLSLLKSESDEKQTIQLILVGQPELEDQFYTASLRLLDQEDIHYCRLEPLVNSEIEPYIEDCLQYVGSSRKGLFSTQALERVAYYSKGFPLSINALCGGALLSASLEEQTVVSAEMIDEAAKYCQIPDSEYETVNSALSNDWEIPASLSDDGDITQKYTGEYSKPDLVESEIYLDEVDADDLEPLLDHQTETDEVDVEQKKNLAKVLAIAAAIALLVGGGFFLAFESSQLMSEQIASLHNAIEGSTAKGREPKSQNINTQPSAVIEKSIPPSTESGEAEIFASMETPQQQKPVLPLPADIGENKSDISLLVKNRLEGLLLVADQQFAAKQLMTPEDDCAWQTYQIILEQQSDNAQALAGISKIKQTYVRWARYEAQKNNLRHAKFLYDRALKAVPDDVELMTEIRQLDAKKLAFNGFQTPAHKPETTPGNSSQAQLAQLYQQAEEQIIKRQLLTPKNDNAVNSYQTMLEIEPGNVEAIEGLGQVKQIYVIWGESEMDKKNWSRAKMFFQRALSLTPGDQYVLNLLDHMHQDD